MFEGLSALVSRWGGNNWAQDMFAAMVTYLVSLGLSKALNCGAS